MTNSSQLFSKKYLQDGDFLVAIERIKIKHKLFRVIAYKLATGETAITTRQMAVSVKKPSYTARQFMRKMGVEPVRVQMPNRSVTDMISISIVMAFWKSLNESGEGNPLTKIGLIYLDEYLTESEVS
ncbi:MAG: hypothetical protein WBA07_13260 [Rivularia sp. (in: cyanobacteria)]